MTSVTSLFVSHNTLGSKDHSLGDAMAAAKTIFLSCLVAALGFLVYRELQIVTVGFSLDPLYIPAKRSDVFRMLLEEPEVWVNIHPLW